MTPFRQFFRFAIAGALGFVTDAGVLYGALKLGAGPYEGRLLSFLCAVYITWQFNRRFTFLGGKPRSAWREWCEYLGAMAFGGACNYAAYAAAITYIPLGKATPIVAVAIGSVAGMFVNFISAKKFVFR